ncbi:MAG TPA: class I SAM-dependent methyltransferase [Levilinea sp.]|nr:class I SAM-dependent methyltransferase [Levilinea sp.]
MDIRSFNRRAWDRQVEQGNIWTRPVSSEEVAAARRGEWQVLLTPTKPVPQEWFGSVLAKDILCLASGGGQQGPILAAAGARVTVLDNSPRQLGQDRMVAERDGLAITLVEGSMIDLSMFPDESFDLIFHPVSNVFVPDVRPVWRQAFRVLRHGGDLLSGFNNPLLYLFDMEKFDRGELEVRWSIPYSDVESLTQEQMQEFEQQGRPLEWSHTLETQVGGQIGAGFLIAGFYEDISPGDALEKIIPTFIATRAIKR